MVEYTHEVFMTRSKGQPTTYYYHQPTRCVYDLNHKLVNDNWIVLSPKHWDIREINPSLENK